MVKLSITLRKIKKYASALLNPKLCSVEYFILSSYLDESGKENKSYLVTKKGCDMVVNKMDVTVLLVSTPNHDRFGAVLLLIAVMRTTLSDFDYTVINSIN